VGKAGSGKSTVARYFVNRLHFRKLAFADAVKLEAEAIFNRAMIKPKDRQLLQWLGDGARQFDENVWINHFGMLLHTIEAAYRKNQIKYNGIVVDDCRYPNEAEYLRQQGFKIFKLVGRGYKLPKKVAKHPSETGVDKIFADTVIDASGTVKQIAKVIMEHMRAYG